ncbi:hypothetical protein [Bacillus sp. FSL K6-3431]|uniref:hypothetical protein n=1 Tax=Bacillus sp. FSL K6-3431 TaxID=2921500 RepID=UPI0030F4EE83
MSVVHLNQSHLSKEVQTLYEDLHQMQHASASINGLIYRGDVAHPLHIPKAGSALNLMPANVEVKGPTLFSFGSLSQYNPENSNQKNIWQRLRFNDTFSAAELNYLIRNNSVPSFSLVYFPDLDQRVHKNGPTDIKGIVKSDQQLQEILNSYPSWEEALDKAIGLFMVTADSLSLKRNGIKP